MVIRPILFIPTIRGRTRADDPLAVADYDHRLRPMPILVVGLMNVVSDFTTGCEVRPIRAALRRWPRAYC